MSVFKLDPNVNASGVHFHGHIIHIPFMQLIKRLGKARYEFEASKTQFEWYFSEEEGLPVVLYDYKADSESPSEWHVGARTSAMAAEFVRWFKSKDWDAEQ